MSARERERERVCKRLVALRGPVIAQRLQSMGIQEVAGEHYRFLKGQSSVSTLWD